MFFLLKALNKNLIKNKSQRVYDHEITESIVKDSTAKKVIENFFNLKSLDSLKK